MNLGIGHVCVVGYSSSYLNPLISVSSPGSSVTAIALQVFMTLCIICCSIAVRSWLCLIYAQVGL